MIKYSGEFELRKFVVPEFVFGVDARLLAGRYAHNLGARKVLVVTDPGVIAAGWTEQVIKSLVSEGVAHVVFDSVTPNPRAEEVMIGAQVYRDEGCNAIVAVGGGSPIDCAKGIGIVSANHRHVLTFEGVDEVDIPGPPLICVPTTAGSSADISQFAIITDVQRRVKIAIVSKTVVPDVSLIDPVTTTTMDAALTASTGMDVLAHAIESYVSNAHSSITDLHALEAVRLLSSVLPSVIERPQDIVLRGKVMLASLHAGVAFSNASLGAVHAMAHSLGGFLDFAHGDANAHLLAHVVDFNFDAVADRYTSVGKAMGVDLSPSQGKSELSAALSSFRERVGLVPTLSQIGVRREDIPTLAEKAMLDPCMITNPRRPTQQDIEGIYERAF